MAWQIAGPIIGFIGIVVVVVLFLLPRRERVEIRISNLNYQVHGVDRKLTVYLGIEIQRSGRKEMRYVKQILLQPDKQIYGQLCDYFNLPSDGLIRINEQIKLPRDYKATFSHMASESPNYPVYTALPELPKDTETRDKAKEIALELSQKMHKVGLVWDDNGKTVWKIVTKEDWGEWV